MRVVALLVLLPHMGLPMGLTGQTPLISAGDDVLVSRDEAYPHVEPHLVVDPSDPSRLVAAAMTLPEEGGGFRIRVYRSTDGGATWRGRTVQTSAATRRTPDGPPPAGAVTAEGDDPYLAHGPDGTLYLVHLPGLVWRSWDGGATWAAPTVLPRGEGRAYDFPRIAVDGSEAAFSGRVYVAATQTVESDDEGAVRALATLRSGDRGGAFDWPHHLRTNDFANKNGDLAVLPDGTLLATWHELFHEGGAVESPRLWSTRSEDGGASFSTSSLVTSGFISLSPELTVDRSSGPHRGRVYAVWLGLRGDRDHYVSHTDDAGTTWSGPRSVVARDDTTHFPTPMVAAVGPDGTLGVLWSENLAQMGQDCFEMRFTASEDGGMTFSEPIAVSDIPSCSDTPPNQAVISHDGPRRATVARRFPAGGDYFGLVGMPDGSFRAVWADARRGPFELWADRLEIQRR